MTQPAKLRFDDGGALCVSGDLSIQQILESSARRLGLFLGSVRSLEMHDGEYLVRDARSGLKRGVWTLWEDVLLLAMTERTLCCQGLSGDADVAIGPMKIHRNAQSLADALGALVFMFVKTDNAWPERIPASTVDRLDRIKNEFDSWITAMAPDTTAPSTPPPASPRKTGRPIDTNLAEDARIAGAWNTKNYATFADCAAALGIEGVNPGRSVKLAVDRVRKRANKGD